MQKNIDNLAMQKMFIIALPFSNVSAELQKDLNDLVMTLKTGQQQRGSPIHVIVICFVVAGLYQCLNAAYAVIPTRMAKCLRNITEYVVSVYTAILHTLQPCCNSSIIMVYFV